MKINKIIALALIAVSTAACDDDDNNVNTNDVTVSMQESTLNVSEDVVAGVYYNLPVVLSGETNGPVTVEVQLTEVSQNPATEDEDYLFTSKKIVIPAGEQVGNFEFYSIGDNEINADRQFIATIISAEGANIGNEKTCLVTLIDNEKFLPEAYADIQGTYIATGSSASGSLEFPLTITGYPEDDPRYLNEVMTSGWRNYEFVTAPATVILDAVTMEVTLQFSIGSTMAEGVEFQGLGACDVKLCGFDGQYYYTSGTISMKSNPERTSFATEGLGILGGVYLNDQFQGSWFAWENVSMVKQ